LAVLNYSGLPAHLPPDRVCGKGECPVGEEDVALHVSRFESPKKLNKNIILYSERWVGRLYG
jgi:hypothetical protein